MPNGGSDCCGTCWFNGVNHGVAGYPDHSTLDGEQFFCEIRGIEIERPFWTYCANHPHHNRDRVEVPVGPVFVCEDGFSRHEWLPGPDNPVVRRKLVEFLEAIPEQPTSEYPSPTSFDEQVIAQLVQLDERAAIPGLKRVANFDPFAFPPGNFQRPRAELVGHAIEALARLAGDAALTELKRCLSCGHDVVPADKRQDDAQADPAAVVRYHAVRGLRFCGSQEAKQMLADATRDPNPEVAAFAKGMLAERGKAESSDIGDSR
jgi:hypothetical protein